MLMYVCVSMKHIIFLHIIYSNLNPRGSSIGWEPCLKKWKLLVQISHPLSPWGQLLLKKSIHFNLSAFVIYTKLSLSKKPPSLPNSFCSYRGKFAIKLLTHTKIPHWNYLPISETIINDCPTQLNRWLTTQTPSCHFL